MRGSEGNFLDLALSQNYSQARVLSKKTKHTNQDEMATALPTPNLQKNALTPLARHELGAT
jgi:hypothetical protein